MRFSRLMLGTVQFGLDYGINNPAGKPASGDIDAILDEAADGGINVIDTARTYGDSEERLAAALQRRGLQKHFKIITKIKSFPDTLSESEAETWIDKSFTASLKALKRDNIEGLLFHRELDLKYLPLLEKLQQKGLICFYGVSLDSKQTADINVVPAAQIPSNILDRRFLAYARRAAQQSALVFTRSVYLQGLLFKPAAQLPQTFSDLLAIRQKLEFLAAESDLLPAELYFRYLLSNPDFTSILTGVDTAGQLQENLRLAEAGPLPTDLLAQIDALVPELPENLIRPSAWQI